MPPDVANTSSEGYGDDGKKSRHVRVGDVNRLELSEHLCVCVCVSLYAGIRLCECVCVRTPLFSTVCVYVCMCLSENG